MQPRNPCLLQQCRKGSIFARNIENGQLQRGEKFSDESTFTPGEGVPKMVHRLSTASRYYPKFAVKTVAHPGGEMVLGVFSRNLGLGGVCFLKIQQ